LCNSTTCASFNLSGKTEDSIDLFTKFDMGFETAGFDNFKILDDIPSFPVAKKATYLCLFYLSVFQQIHYRWD